MARFLALRIERRRLDLLISRTFGISYSLRPAEDCVTVHTALAVSFPR